MKGHSSKARAKSRPSRRRTQSAPLTRIVLLDALRTWVIPTMAGVTGFLICVLYNVEVVDSDLSVTIIGMLALGVVLFYGLRGFTEPPFDARLAGILIVFAILWSITSCYPFYRTVNPGTPLFATELH